MSKFYYNENLDIAHLVHSDGKVEVYIGDYAPDWAIINSGHWFNGLPNCDYSNFILVGRF